MSSSSTAGVKHRVAAYVKSRAGIEGGGGGAALELRKDDGGRFTPRPDVGERERGGRDTGEK